MFTASRLSLPSALTVISTNIEGLSDVKASVLSELCNKQQCHCLCLQQTHRDAREARSRSHGMTLVVLRPHDKYEIVISLRDDLKVMIIFVTASNYVEVTTAELPDVVLHSERSVYSLNWNTEAYPIL